MYYKFKDCEASLNDRWTHEGMGWSPDFEVDNPKYKDWDSYDKYHSSYWMERGYVLEPMMVKGLKMRRNDLKKSAANWDMGTWARSAALALHDIK